ncbi:MAG TPA: type II secretion system protein [Verrucomicrobiae bacterium]|nr:type II secretion system protein [Verrucomicrobiae bacterium]
MTYRRAFTVLEALIVVAVFGLLATLAVLSLNSARASLRDAQRLSDISTVRAGLSQYWLEKANYPVADSVLIGQPGANKLSSAGFVDQSDQATPVYIENLSGGPKSGEYYRYHGSANGYSIRFQTETKTDLGAPNVYYAHASGIDREDSDK